MNSAAFVFPVRIYYEDTDAGGVVYHANYLRFMERARTEWLRDHGYEINKLEQDFGFLFAVRSVSIDYLKPAYLNDLLSIQVSIARTGRASLDIDQEVYRDKVLLCRARIKLAGVAVDTFRPMALPFTLD
ncbi:MAG: tol-pal system-associated acyl-CoA thioesterase [Gammaproteobacteria bacterium]|nr:tol-pal system-associated acyl-CoA thioesterase [Gammaproteobacteria bacterium]MDX2488279.1 tol-pal system-associated acyl-CoA thioesterase [Gammaproteobacteria bacterium]